MTDQSAPRGGATAAVLGGYGAVGRQILRSAARRGFRVTAVGRDASRLRSTAAHAYELADVRDPEDVARISRAHDVVVNATGLEATDLARLVTSSGAAFVDISADPDYLERLAALRPARPVLAGTGLAPGLTNLLAAAVPGDDPVQIGIVGGVGDHHGDAGRDWIWRVAGRRVPGSSGERVYRTARAFDIPGLGRRTLVRAAFGEELQLSRTQGRDVSTWLGLDPGAATALLRLAGALPPVGRFLDGLSAPLARLFGSRPGTMARAYDRWFVVVTAGDETAAWASGRSETLATSVVTALSLAPTLSAPAGVWTADGLLSLSEVERELHAAGIRTGAPVLEDC